MCGPGKFHFQLPNFIAARPDKRVPSTAFPGEKRYPAGTSTSTNVRLTEAEIDAVSTACRTAVGFPQITIVCQQIRGHSVRVLLDPAARREPGARWVNS
jgi:hypothetical protein